MKDIYSFTFVFCILILSSNITQAQLDSTLNWKWSKRFISTERGFIRDSELDEYGNLYVIGSFTGKIDIDGSIYNGEEIFADAYIAKFDSQGKKLWVNFIFGEGYNRTSKLIRDSLGNIYVLGDFEKKANFNGLMLTTNVPTGFLAKYKGNGELLWVKPRTEASLPFSLSLTKDNRVVTAGLSRSSAYMELYSSEGKLLWSRIMKSYITGVQQLTVADFVGIDNNNDIYLSGEFEGAEFDAGESNMLYNSITSIYIPIRKRFIAKYNIDGMIYWAKNVSTNDDCNCHASVATQMDNNGNLYHFGKFHESSDIGFPIDNYHSFGLYAVKYTGEGNISDAFLISPSTLYYNVRGVRFDTHNNLYIYGSYTSYPLYFSESVALEPDSVHRMFIAKFNSSQQLDWAENISNGSGDNSVNTISIDINSNFYIGGESSGSLIIGDSSKFDSTETREYHAIIAKSNGRKTFKTVNKDTLNIPTHNSLPVNIDISVINQEIRFIPFVNSNKVVQLSIATTNGQIVFSATMDSTEKQPLVFNTLKLANGFYFLSISTAENTQLKKLFINR